MGYVGRKQDEATRNRPYVSGAPRRIYFRSFQFKRSEDQTAAARVVARHLRHADIVDSTQPARFVNVRNLVGIAGITYRPGIEPSPLGPSSNKRMIELII